MTREEKVLKRKARAQRRIQKRLKEREAVKAATRWGQYPLAAARYKVKHGYYNSWYDPNSPTGYSQVCSYEAYGTCQSPCNGDC
jgi:hypothetical protein